MKSTQELIQDARTALLDRFGIFGGGHDLNAVFDILNKAWEQEDAKVSPDYDMISFAAFCGKNGECGYDPKTDRWLLDDVASATTAEMLEGWKKQQIPPL